MYMFDTSVKCQELRFYVTEVAFLIDVFPFLRSLFQVLTGWLVLVGKYSFQDNIRIRVVFPLFICE